MGKVKVDGNCFYSDCFVRSYFVALQNRPIQYDELVRALLLLNDNSDLVAGLVFEKGEEFGTGDVIIRVVDAQPAHLYLNGNNYGRFLTTSTRAGARLDFGNFLKEGDMFSIAEVLGFPLTALYFTDIRYTAPINRQGTSLEGAYLTSAFKVDEFKEFDLRGKSDIATLKINHALIRERFLNVDLFSYFDYKQIRNTEHTHSISFDKLRVLTFGALIDQFSPCGIRDYLVLQAGVGIPDFLGGLKAVDDSSSRLGGGGRFVVLNLDYDRLQEIYLPDFYFYFHGSAQWSPDRLTLPEVIYIGGDGTVRGYPLAEALGDSGYYLNFEFRFPPPFIGDKEFFVSNKKWRDIIQFDVFFDHGGVFARSLDKTFLSGAGLGVRIYGPCSLFLSVDMGFPLNRGYDSRGAFVYIKLTAQPF